MSSRLFVSELLSDEALAQEVLPTDVEASRAFASPRRRREFLSWRALVYRHLGRDVRLGYDAAGGPIIEDSELCLGVSHSTDRVAVIISDRPCAVDVEPVGRNFGRVVAKFLTDEECARFTSQQELAAAWCAKETLYKYARRQLSFRDDIIVESIDLDAGRIVGRVGGGEAKELNVAIEGDYITVYVD